LIVLVVLLLVFGAKRLPEMGRGIGSGIRGFKDGLTAHDEPEHAEPPAPQASALALPPATPATPATPAAQAAEPGAVEPTTGDGTKADSEPLHAA
jgi:sec-independent protein translocase protein TatA